MDMRWSGGTCRPCVCVSVATGEQKHLFKAWMAEAVLYRLCQVRAQTFIDNIGPETVESLFLPCSRNHFGMQVVLTREA